MFQEALLFDQPLSGWNTSAVGSTVNGGMVFMLQNASLFDQDVRDWDVSRRVQDLGNMFMDASAFRQNLCDWGDQISITQNANQLLICFLTLDVQTTPLKLPTSIAIQ